MSHRSRERRADNEYNIPSEEMSRGRYDDRSRRRSRSPYRWREQDTRRGMSRERYDDRNRRRSRSPFQRREPDTWMNEERAEHQHRTSYSRPEQSSMENKERAGNQHRSSYSRLEPSSMENGGRAGNQHRSSYSRPDISSADSPQEVREQNISNPPVSSTPKMAPVTSTMEKLEEYRSALLSLVRENPRLWDPTHAFYNNRRMKDKVWVEINRKLGADPSLGITERDCRKYWSKLRIRFARESRTLPEFIEDDFKKLMDTELGFLKSIPSPTKTCEDSTSAAGNTTTNGKASQPVLDRAVLQALLASHLSSTPTTENQSVSMKHLDPQAAPSKQSRDRPSTSKIFDAPIPHTAKPHTLSSGRRQRDDSFSDAESSEEEDPSDLQLELENLVKERRRVLSILSNVFPASGGNNSDSDLALVATVAANIAHFSPTMKKLMLEEVRLVKERFP